MPVVYLTAARGWTFHKTPECYELRQAGELLSRPLEELGHTASPCRACFRDAPKKLKLYRRFCPECATSRRAKPCAHNGGVQVWIHQPGGGYGSRGKRRVSSNRRVWVWPDQAARYQKQD